MKTFMAIALALLTSAVMAASYPRLVKNFQEFDRFPMEVAGYVRGEVVEYAPNMTAYEVGYNRYDDTAQSAVTLYVTPPTPDVESGFKEQEGVILQAHAAAKLISRQQIVIKQGDVSYDATLVRFEFDEIFARSRQHVSSLLVLSYRPEATYKARATAPIAQAEAAEASMLRLLESVRWERPK